MQVEPEAFGHLGDGSGEEREDDGGLEDDSWADTARGGSAPCAAARSAPSAAAAAATPPAAAGAEEGQPRAQGHDEKTAGLEPLAGPALSGARVAWEKRLGVTAKEVGFLEFASRLEALPLPAEDRGELRRFLEGMQQLLASAGARPRGPGGSASGAA